MQEWGRARVASQWADDEEAIKEAVATCPVDCIYYVSDYSNMPQMPQNNQTNVRVSECEPLLATTCTPVLAVVHWTI